MNPVEAAARELLGVPFRLHGRDRRFGVDCVGLVAASLAAAGWAGAVPDRYRLRFGDERAATDWMNARLARRTGAAEAGDVLLLRSGPGQLHLAIQATAGLIHADAGVGRVVLRPGASPWPGLGAWYIGKE